MRDRATCSRPAASLLLLDQVAAAAAASVITHQRRLFANYWRRYSQLMTMEVAWSCRGR